MSKQSFLQSFLLANGSNSIQRSPMHSAGSVRLDKWLWAVRLYKSRSLAIQACQAGHVKIGGQRVKPSRGIYPGDIISVLAAQVHRTVRVLGLLEQRVGALRVGEFLEDLTPPGEYARARAEALAAAPRFPRGVGRPTKKQRRRLEVFFRQPNE